MAVAQIYERYLERTETFMYAYLKALRDPQPVVLSRKKTINLDLFPFPAGDIFDLSVRKHSVQSLGSAVARRVFSVPLERQERNRALQVFRGRRPQLLHAHYGTVGHWCLPLRKKLGIPLITTFYGFDAAPDLAALSSWPEARKNLFAEGDLFLVEGPAFKQRLVSLGCPESKIRVQRIAISVPQRRSNQIKNNIPIILSTGRFVEKKGLIYAIDAASILARAGYRFEFHIIGDGPLKSSLVSRVQHHGLEDRVHFLGLLQHDAYLQELQNADIVVQPSVTGQNGDTEGGAPTVILEALGRGIPIVSTLHADIPNIVPREQHPFLSSERDAEGLACAVARFLDSEELRREIGGLGHNFIRARHDIAKEARLLEECYRAMLGQVDLDKGVEQLSSGR